MRIFNNREIASAIWLIILLAFLLPRRTARQSFVNLLRCLFSYKLLMPFGLMALYVAGTVWLLATARMWDVSMLKDTILWFILSAAAMAVRVISDSKSDDALRHAIVSNFTIVVIVEFMVNFYTFPLPVELVLVPMAAVVSALNAFAANDEENLVVFNITQVMLMLLGAAVIGYAIYSAAADLQHFATTDTIKSVMLAPALSVLFAPCLYLAMLMATYEQFLVGLRMGNPKTPYLMTYARRRILMYGGLSIRRVRHLRDSHWGDIMHISSRQDVDRIVDRSEAA
ncbi:MAG: hypothetical protein ABFD96_20130 [Armatimonadia bacterium]